jgi:hypothetical protein
MARQPTTMTVLNDGKEQWREVSHYDKENHRYVPNLLPGEDVVWHVGQFYPTVIKTQIVGDDDHPDGYEVCAMCEMPFFIKRCSRCGYEPA